MDGQRPDGKELETRRGRKDTDRNKYSALIKVISPRGMTDGGSSALP